MIHFSIDFIGDFVPQDLDLQSGSVSLTQMNLDPTRSGSTTLATCPLLCGHVVFSGGYCSPLTYTIIVLTDWVTEVAGAYSMVSPQCGLP